MKRHGCCVVVILPPMDDERLHALLVELDQVCHKPVEGNPSDESTQGGGQ